MSAVVVNVTPDTPEWELERRSSIGASDVAAVLGLSPWGDTPRSVYREKLGLGDEFDAELGFIGHEQEKLMAAWLERFHPEVGHIEPAVMLRSVEYPHLHASLDRIAVKGDQRAPIQMKTAMHFAGKEWDEGVPDWVQVQVQTEMLVGGFPFAWVVAFVGGRRFFLYKVEADLVVQEQIADITARFWTGHVLTKVEPDAITVAELDAAKANTGQSIEGDERLLMAWYLDGLERSTFKTAEENIEAVKAAYKELLSDGDADALTFGGRELYTWKRSKAVVSFDRARFEQEHPELVTEYTRVVPGSMRFLRKTVKEFEENPPEGWEAGLSVADVLATYQDLSIWKRDAA